jgi:hypothetical protein
VQIVTVAQLFDGKGVEMPEVARMRAFKEAEQVKEGGAAQGRLDL